MIQSITMQVEDDNTNTSTIMMGQEALWVEDGTSPNGDDSKNKTSTAKSMSFKKSFFGGGACGSKKKESHGSNRRHVLLIDSETSMDEDEVPGEDKITISKELQAATLILNARKLLQESTSSSSQQQESLARSAFDSASEARRLLDKYSESREMVQVLRDATEKGVDAVVEKDDYDRAQQLLEFVLPANIDETYLQQAAASLKKEKSEASMQNGESIISSLDLKSPRRNQDELDILSMSSLNEILDGPISPNNVPHEIETSKSPEILESNVPPRKGGRLFKNIFQNGKNKSKATKITMAEPSQEDIQRFSATDTFEDIASPIGRPGMVLRVSHTMDESEEEDDCEKPDQIADSRALQAEERMQALLESAMKEDDDACSLTSMDGVPQYTTEKPKAQQDVEHAIQQVLSQDETSASSHFLQSLPPTFVSAPRVDPAAYLGHAGLARLEQLGLIDEDDGVPTTTMEESDIESPPEIADFQPTLTSPSSTTSNDDNEDEKTTDKYAVVAQGGDISEDKYTVLPNPCSFCESLGWLSPQSATSEQFEVTALNEETPDKYAAPELVSTMDSSPESEAGLTEKETEEEGEAQPKCGLFSKKNMRFSHKSAVDEDVDDIVSSSSSFRQSPWRSFIRMGKGSKAPENETARYKISVIDTSVSEFPMPNLADKDATESSSESGSDHAERTQTINSMSTVVASSD